MASKTYPGDIVAAGLTPSFNILPESELDITPVDEGSLSVGVSSPVSAGNLDLLRTEAQVTGAVFASTVGNAPACQERIEVGYRPPALTYLRSAIAIYDSSYAPYRDAKRGPWHAPDRLAGLWAEGFADPASAVLASSAALIDNDYTNPAHSYAGTSYCAAGVTVGTYVDGVAYAPVVSALMVGTDALIHWPINANQKIYGSNDNAVWTEIPASTLTSGGFSAGRGSYSGGSPWAGLGYIILFAAEQSYCHYMATFKNVNGSTTAITEIAALSRYGDVSISDDFEYYRGIAPSGVSAIGPVVSGVTTQVKHVFPADATVADCRWLWRGAVFGAVSLIPKDDSVGMCHLELYSDNAKAGFASALGAAITTSSETAEAGEEGEYASYNVSNLHPTLAAAQVDVWMPVDPQEVTAEDLDNEGNTTGFLPVAAKNLTQVGRVCNLLRTADGSLGDTSVTLGGAMAAWTEVAWAATPAGTQYAINYATSAYKTGNAVPAGATWTGAYFGLGSQNTDLSEDGSTPVYAASVLTLTGGTVAANGGLAPFKSRANFSNWPDSFSRKCRRSVYVRVKFASGAA